MDKGVWKEAAREDANEEVIGSCDKCEGRVCAEEGEDVSVVKGGERGGKRICERTVEKRIHLAVKVTTNSAGVLHRKEGW